MFSTLEYELTSNNQYFYDPALNPLAVQVFQEKTNAIVDYLQEELKEQITSLLTPIKRAWSQVVAENSETSPKKVVKNQDIKRKLSELGKLIQEVKSIAKSSAVKFENVE